MKSHNRSRLAALALAAALVGSLFLSSCGKEKSQSPQQVPQEQTAAVNVNYGISNPWDSLMPYYSVSWPMFRPTEPASPGLRSVGRVPMTAIPLYFS